MEAVHQPDIFSLISTTEDLGLFYKELDQINTGLFKAGTNTEKLLDSVLSGKKKELLLSFFTKQKMDYKNPIDFQNAITKLKKIGDALPVVKLTIAIEPSTKMVKNLTAWGQENIPSKFLLKFAVDQRFIGGAYITTEGLFKDYTLKSKIDELFEKKNYGKL